MGCLFELIFEVIFEVVLEGALYIVRRLALLIKHIKK